MISVVVVIVVVVYVLFYKEIFAMTFDETMAQHMGINIKLVNIIFMIMLGVTLSIAAKTVGTLILSSLLILPVATAMQLSKSYRSTLMWSLFFSLFYMIGGLILSFYLGAKPGGTVVLLAVLTYMALLPLKRVRS